MSYMFENRTGQTGSGPITKIHKLDNLIFISLWFSPRLALSLRLALIPWITIPWSTSLLVTITGIFIPSLAPQPAHYPYSL